jgi:hypothetical protein
VGSTPRHSIIQQPNDGDDNNNKKEKKKKTFVHNLFG